MKWSKLKQTIEEERFADSVKGRVHIYSTRYTIASFFMARNWITIDKIEIANFSTAEVYNKFGGWNFPDANHRIRDEERVNGNAVEKGEFTRDHFMGACNDFLNLSIDEAMASDDTIIKALAMLDKRLGKRRLVLIDKAGLHPLVLRLLEFRLECESITPSSLS